MEDPNSSTTSRPVATDEPPPASAPAHPNSLAHSSASPGGVWRSIVGHLKNIQEVLAAIAAIAVAIAFALNYFATSRDLECFKTEARNSNGLVQTTLQINDLTASWQLITIKLRQLDQKSKAPNIAPNSPEYEAILKEIVATQAQSDDIFKSLNAARDRKLELVRSAKTCD
ncbi:MAG TPA: hypothetical protein PKC42_03765 [Candidatus Nanoperiomorbaceae bacterium]|nr:hypothetical protein [Candidatus Nanoperiomorbaceae bacterium]